MLRTNSKSTVIVPASDSSHGKPIGTGNVQKQGQPLEIKNGLYEFDFGSEFEGGEPQTLHSDTNLSVHSEGLGASDSTVETSKLFIPWDDQDSIENSHLDAVEGDSSRDEDEPAPSPKPLQTTPGSAPPAPQFSDDPAIAALQKSQLENTKSVVCYTESLALLDKALKDNPNLPKNSFDFIKKILSDGLQRCADRASDLSEGTQQALDAHAEQARQLAAGAQGDGVAVSEGDETFSMDSIGTVTQADLDHELDVLKGIVSPSAHQRVATAVNTALNGGLESVDQDLATLHQQVNEEAEQAQQQQENDEQLAQLAARHDNNAAELDHLFSQLEANFPANEDDNQFNQELDDAIAFAEGMNTGGADQFLNDLASGLAAPSQVTPPSSQQGVSTQPVQVAPTHTGPVDLAAVQNELLAEVEGLLQQEQEDKAALSKTTPSQIQPIGATGKPAVLTVTDQDLLKISFQEVHRASAAMTDLDMKLKNIVARPLTEAETLELKAIGIQIKDNASEQNRQQLRRREIVATVRKFQKEQENIINKSQIEVIAIASGKAMQEYSDYERKIRLLELQKMHTTADEMVAYGNRRIGGL